MKNSDYKVSIIIPCFNEEGNISLIYNRINDSIASICKYEMIFIDDGSLDNTLQKIKELQQKEVQIHFISLSRNFGHQNALKAGYDYASGDCVVSLDADLQHPPEMIPQMIEKWQQGYDVVYTVRSKEKKRGIFKQFSSFMFYKFANRLSEVEIPDSAADFRLVDRKVVNVIKDLKENYLFLRGLISWLGFRQTSIFFKADERNSGKSKYSVRKMLSFATSGITSFSLKPLYLSIYIGFFIAFIAFVYLLFVLFTFLFTERNLAGWTSLIASVLFIGGIQLVMIGILGEYLGKTFIENKRRPNYIISEKSL